MTNRLIRYDSLLLKRALGDGFRGPADIVLLAIVMGLGIAWLRMRLTEAAPVLPGEAVWLAALVGPVAFAWHRLALGRLARLAEASPVAPAALRRDERRAYLILAHGLAASFLLILALLIGAAAGRPGAGCGLGALAYAAGAALAAAWPDLRRRRAGEVPGAGSLADLGSGGAAVLALVLRRQTFGPGRAAAQVAAALAAGFWLTLAAALWGQARSQAVQTLVVLLPSFLLLLRAARLDAQLLAFLPQAGFGPGFIAFAVAALPLASLPVSAIAALIGGAGMAALALLAFLHLFFILIGIARAWLYPGREARGAELQLQLELTGLAIVAFLMPPIALLALVWRLDLLRRHCRRLRWMQP